MLRDVDLSKISDGVSYGPEDLVKMGCNECNNCHLCCTGMGSSIILDPYDIYNLEKATGKDIKELLENHLELNVVDGVIAPNLKMEEGRDRCTFLSKEGRCTIHELRPGFCRLFPLGRVYEEEGFFYIHQNKECPYPNKTKVKIKKWLGITNYKEYEQFILTWHNFLKSMQEFINICQDENQIKTLNMLILNTFYLTMYNVEEDFYGQLYDRLADINSKLGLN